MQVQIKLRFVTVFCDLSLYQLPGFDKALTYRAFSILLAICVGWFSATSLVGRTPAGRQCPTAPVQSIHVAVYDCCHRLVGYTTRAVHPGDKEFVQCQCAEKTAAQQKIVLNPKIDLWFPSDPIAVDAQPEAIVHDSYRAPRLDKEQLISEPRIPPPLIA